MKWFGKNWGAPCCEPNDHVATPIGSSCVRCLNPIAADDNGFLLPCVTADRASAYEVAYHRACLQQALTPCPGCPICRPVEARFLMEPALAFALLIATDERNHLVQCSCGVSFLSAAARRDANGRLLCIACGAPTAERSLPS